MEPTDSTEPTGSPLRAARIAAGLNQEELFEKSGVPQGTISRIERGQSPHTTVALRLARALGTTVEALFGHSVAEGAPDADDAPSDARAA